MQFLSAIVQQRGALGAGDAVGWTIRLAKRVELLHGEAQVHGSISALASRAGGTSPSAAAQLVDARSAPDVAAYRSPERPPAGPGSVADDVWAVAVTLYFLLTGEPPFPGASYDEVQWKSLAAPPPPLRARNVDDAELQRIVDRCFTLDLGARIVETAELRRRLEAWGAAKDLGELPPLDPDDGQVPVLPFGSEDDEKTVVRSYQGPALRQIVDLASGKSDTPDPEPPPSKAAPEPVPASRPVPSSRPAPAPRSAPPSRRPPSSRPAPALSNILAMAARVVKPSRPASKSKPEPAPATPAADGAAATTSTPAGREAPIPTPAVDAAPPTTAERPAPIETAPGALHAHGEVRGNPFEPRRSRAGWIVGGVVAGALVAVGAFALSGRDSHGDSEVAAPTASAAPPSPGAVPVAAGASSAGKPDPDACMLALFAPDTFDSAAAPGLSGICSETDPRRGGAALRSIVVRAGSNRAPSEGMKEWAMLGWYDMAAFAVMRGRCCASAPPIALPPTPGGCEPIADLLNELGAAVASGAETKANDVVDRYGNAARCVTRGGAGSLFGRIRGPQGGEATAFAKTLARALPARAP